MSIITLSDLDAELLAHGRTGDKAFIEFRLKDGMIVKFALTPQEADEVIESWAECLPSIGELWSRTIPERGVYVR